MSRCNRRSGGVRPSQCNREADEGYMQCSVCRATEARSARERRKRADMPAYMLVGTPYDPSAMNLPKRPPGAR